MRSKKALKNIIASIIQQLIVVVCGLVLPRAIINNYGSDVNGLVSSITQFLTYIVLLEAGIGPVIKSVLYKPLHNKDKTTIEKILKSAQKFFNVIAYIFIAYLVVLCFVYPIFVNSQFGTWYTVSLILIISISTFAEYFFGVVYNLYLQADQKTYITANIQSITTILNTVLCVILIRSGFNIQVVKLVSSFVFVLRPIIQNIYVRKKYGINLKEVKEKYELKQKWDGLAQHIASVIHLNTDVTLLTIFSTTAEISVYSVYLFVVKGIRSLVQSLTAGIDAIFGDMYVENNKEALAKNFKVYEFFYYTLITIIFSCTLCLILPFVKIYTIGVTDVNYYRPVFAYIMVAAEYIWAVRLPYTSITLAVGRFKETQKGAWIEAIVNIVISLILVNKIGIVGVAIGTLIAMVIRTIEFMYHSAKYVLCRKQFHAYMHFVVLAIETLIIFFIVNLIIKNVNFKNYFVWVKYGIISAIVATLIVGILNCIVYRSDVKIVFDRIKNILSNRKNKKQNAD